MCLPSDRPISVWFANHSVQKVVEKRRSSRARSEDGHAAEAAVGGGIGHVGDVGFRVGRDPSRAGAYGMVASGLFVWPLITITL